MFASSRAVGRVVAIQRRGRNVIVTLGPVTFTDVVRDADLNFTMPVKREGINLYRSESPATSASLSATPSANVLRPAAWEEPEQPFRLIPIGLSHKNTVKFKVGSWEIEEWMKKKGSVPEDVLSQGTLGAGKEQPDPSETTNPSEVKTDEGMSEIGLKLLYSIAEGMSGKSKDPGGIQSKGSTGLKFGGSVRLDGENIRLRTHVKVVNGQMSGPSTVVIDGIDMLRLGILGGVENGNTDNVKTRVEIPAELAENIPSELTYGVPLAMHLKFKFIVETAFTGNSTMWTHGEYRLSGPIGIEDGKPVKPSLSVEHPMINDLHGVTTGVSGIVIAVEFRWLVGLGNETWTAGPYMKVIVAAGVTKGSVLAFGLGGLKGGPTCRSVTLKGDIGGGIGVIVDTSKLPAVLVGTMKKLELEVVETTGTFFNQGWFAPDIPLCRAGG